MQLSVQKFILDNADCWEKTLSEKPFFVSTSRSEVFGRRLVMLKYSQFDSDFNIPMVRECRGLVLDESNGYEVVSYAFNKFGNYGEPYCPEIDASTMRVTEKCDGSLMKLVRMNGSDLLISTNGTINAFDAPIAEQVGCRFKSFGEMFQSVLDEKISAFGDSLLSEIKEGYTYMFEMVSPWTRVVVPYPRENLFLIGIRNNVTFEEERFDTHPLAEFFDTPKVFSFGSFDDCVKNARELPWDDEGYVVMDGGFNRVKVKSAAWLSAHHLVSNHVLSYERAYELVRKNEVDEVLCYFPDLKAVFDECGKKFDALVAYDDCAWRRFNESGLAGAVRKDQAKFIIDNFRSKSCGFALLDRKVKSAEEFYRECPISGLLKAIVGRT